MLATAPIPQHLTALQRAHAVRLQHAAVKKEVKDTGCMSEGQRVAAGVLLDPPDLCASLPVADLLAAIPRYGDKTACRVLRSYRISEIKRLGDLTERQRLVLADALPQPRLGDGGGRVSVCRLCGRVPIDEADVALRASGLVCTPGCNRQRYERGSTRRPVHPLPRPEVGDD